MTWNKIIIPFKYFFFKLGIFWTSFFYGMKQGNKLLTDVQDKDNFSAAFGEEQKKVQDNVFGDLLRGELTQRVVETRHEMYLAERESHKYTYVGGGRGRKLNDTFKYNGNAENEDKLKIILVQNNEMLVKGTIDTNPNGSSSLEDFRIHFEYDFFPRFRLDRYCKKVVVKESGEEEYPLVVDVYISKYVVNRPSSFFISEINKIKDGDVNNDILKIKTLSFSTSNAWGEEQSMKKTFGGFKFEKLLEYDGQYILRFKVEGVETEDLCAKYFDETTAEKIKNKAPRDTNKGATFDYVVAAGQIEKKLNGQD